MRSSMADERLVGLRDITEAAERIDDLVLRTPVIELPHPVRFDEVLHCKAESLQPTAAFKLRGAYNAISQALPQAREHGVLAQSSGNHARAVAFVAHRLGLHAVIVMPENTPPAKVAAVRALGAHVELVPIAERDSRALQLAGEAAYVHVPPYDDVRVIAGQGTVGLELVEQLPDVDVVLVPVSGGGLISGVSAAVKALSPHTRVIGVEPELAADATESWRAGRRISWTSEQTSRTIADGLRVTAVGAHPWEHIQRYVDDFVTVSELQIYAAMRHLAVAGRLVAEPSGAVAVAAWMHDLLPGEGTVAAVVSGGSVEPSLLASVLNS